MIRYSNNSLNAYPKTVRLDIQLSKPDDSSYNSISYAKLVNLELGKDISSSELLGLTTEDTHDRFKDYEEESYIDNTEVYRDTFPAGKEPELGGFYVNTGKLKLKTTTVSSVDKNKKEGKKKFSSKTKAVKTKIIRKKESILSKNKKSKHENNNICVNPKMHANIRLDALLNTVRKQKKKGFVKSINMPNTSKHSSAIDASETAKEFCNINPNEKVLSVNKFSEVTSASTKMLLNETEVTIPREDFLSSKTGSFNSRNSTSDSDEVKIVKEIIHSSKINSNEEYMIQNNLNIKTAVTESAQVAAKALLSPSEFIPMDLPYLPLDSLTFDWPSQISPSTPFQATVPKIAYRSSSEVAVEPDFITLNSCSKMPKPLSLPKATVSKNFNSSHKAVTDSTLASNRLFPGTIVRSNSSKSINTSASSKSSKTIKRLERSSSSKETSKAVRTSSSTGTVETVHSSSPGSLKPVRSSSSTGTVNPVCSKFSTDTVKQVCSMSSKGTDKPVLSSSSSGTDKPISSKSSTGTAKPVCSRSSKGTNKSESSKYSTSTVKLVCSRSSKGTNKPARSSSSKETIKPIHSSSSKSTVPEKEFYATCNSATAYTHLQDVPLKESKSKSAEVTIKSTNSSSSNAIFSPFLFISPKATISKIAPDNTVDNNSPTLNVEVRSSFSKATTPKEALLSICAAEYALFQDAAPPKATENILASKKDSCPSNPQDDLKAAVYALFQDAPPTKSTENILANKKDSCLMNPRGNLKVKSKSPKVGSKAVQDKVAKKNPSKTISALASESPYSVYYYDDSLDRKHSDKSSIRTYSKANKNSLQPKLNTVTTCSVATSKTKQTTVMNPMHSSHNTSEVQLYKMNISPIVKYKETHGKF